MSNEIAIEDVIDPDLEITDSHHHLREQYERRYMLDELLADTADGHRVTTTIFVECRFGYDASQPAPLASIGEVRRIAEIAAESRRRGGTTVGGIVGFADLRMGDRVGEVLDKLADAGDGLLTGIRQVTAWDAESGIQAHPTNPGPRLLEHPLFRRGFRQLAMRGLAFDAWLYHTQLPELIDLINTFPDACVILDHFGGPLAVEPYASRSDEVQASWKRNLLALAHFPNVNLKIGGIDLPVIRGAYPGASTSSSSAELAEHWGPRLRWCIESFGPDRCMLESNFPVDKRTIESYRILWNAFKAIIAEYSPAEKVALVKGTADRVYLRHRRAADPGMPAGKDATTILRDPHKAEQSTSHDRLRSAKCRLPWLVLGCLVTQTKLRQRHPVAQRYEAGTYPLADGNLPLVLGQQWIVGANQVTDKAHGYQLILAATPPSNRSLLVKLDQHDRVRNPVAERRLDRVGDDLVAVDRA